MSDEFWFQLYVGIGLAIYIFSLIDMRGKESKKEFDRIAPTEIVGLLFIPFWPLPVIMSIPWMFQAIKNKGKRHG